jgi:hypothetical protein
MAACVIATSDSVAPRIHAAYVLSTFIMLWPCCRETKSTRLRFTHAEQPNDYMALLDHQSGLLDVSKSNCGTSLEFLNKRNGSGFRNFLMPEWSVQHDADFRLHGDRI